jgi:hypothetical protein
MCPLYFPGLGTGRQKAGYITRNARPPYRDLNYISTHTCSRIICHSTRTRLRVFSSIPQFVYRFRGRAAMAVCFFGFFFGTFKE